MKVSHIFGFVALAAFMALGSAVQAQDFVALDHFTMVKIEKPALMATKLDTVEVSGSGIDPTPIKSMDLYFINHFLTKHEGPVGEAAISLYNLSRHTDPDEVQKYFANACELSLGQFHSLLHALYEHKDTTKILLEYGVVTYIRDDSGKLQVVGANMGLDLDAWNIYTGYDYQAGYAWPNAAVACP